MVVEIATRNVPISTQKAGDAFKTLFVTGAFYRGENLDPVAGRDDETFLHDLAVDEGAQTI
jgi:hypothetical protein